MNGKSPQITAVPVLTKYMHQTFLYFKGTALILCRFVMPHPSLVGLGNALSLWGLPVIPWDTLVYPGTSQGHCRLLLNESCSWHVVNDHHSSEEEVVVGLLRDPVGGGRDAVVDPGLARLAAGEARRHQADQHPAAVGLLHLQIDVTS